MAKGEPIQILMAGLGTAFSGYSVYTYVAGSGGATTKALYEDIELTSATTNPVVLDQYGRCSVALYGSGLYEFIIKDTDGATVITWDDLKFDSIVGLDSYYWVDASDYATLEAAVAAIGATTTTLLVSADINCTDNCTIPITTTLKVTNGDIITISSGKVLTINGDVDAGIYQIFAGAGTVSGLRKAYPDWWGTNTTPGTTDMSAEIQAAFDATIASNGTVNFNTVTYYIGTTQLTINYVGGVPVSEQKFTMKMPAGSLIKGSTPSDYLIKIYSLGYSNLELRLQQDSSTGHGVWLGNTATTAFLSNEFYIWLGNSNNPSTTRPALGGGTIGFKIADPLGAGAGYFNWIKGGWIQNFETDIYIESGANANRVDHVTCYNYWNGVLLGSGENQITNIFGTNADGNATAGVNVVIAAASVTVATDLFTSAAHGLISGDEVFISTSGTLPSPLAASTRYFVQKVDADTFKLAREKSGAAGDVIDLQTQGSGNHTIQQVMYTDLVHIGDGTNASNHNNISITGEPGEGDAYERTIFGEYLATGNLIIVGNNTGVAIETSGNLHKDNFVIAGKGGSTTGGMYSMTFNGTTAFNSTILQRASTEYPNGGYIAHLTKVSVHTLSAAAYSDTTDLDIPAGSLLIGALANVNTAIATSTAWKMSFISSETVLEANWTNSGGELLATVTNNVNRWTTGDRVQMTTTTTLPTGLSLLTDYYVVRVSDTTLKFATSLANAFSDTTINWTDDGTGNHTITLYHDIATGGIADLNSKLNGLVPSKIALGETNIRFTSTAGGNFSAGVIEVVAYYIEGSNILSIGQ